MKKLMTLIFAGMMMTAALSGCGSNGGNSSETSTESTTSSAVTSTASESSETESKTESATEELSGSVTMAGSTSMEEMAKAVAEGFNMTWPDVVVDIQLGGSSAGATAAMEGTCDFGNLSRDLKEEEAAVLTGEVVALDGIAVVVNPNNTVEDLTLEQIYDIYTGAVTNWSEVGGDDLEIHVVGREASSGTRDGFESVVDCKDAAQYDEELTSTGAVQTTVSQNPNAIGYVSLANVDETVKAVKVGGVEATAENVSNGSYTLQRPFVMAHLTETPLSDTAQAFIDYVLGEEGQEIVANLGLVPVK